MHLRVLYIACSLFCGLHLYAVPADSSRYGVLDRLRQFIANDIHLDVGDEFYTGWTAAPRYSYVYVSRTDSLVPPSGMRSFLYGGEDSLHADSMVQWYSTVGFHSMHYRTAGTSATRLNTTLWNYPIEAFVFIVIHEAVHVHIQRRGEPIPYTCEEALCDATADYFTPLFLHDDPSGYKAALRQRKVFEKVNELINLLEYTFYHPKENGNSAKLVKELKGWVRKGNSFQRDRYNYAVNNAYLMRYHSYAHHFFTLREKMECYRSPANIIPLLHQGKTEDDAMAILRDWHCVPIGYK